MCNACHQDGHKALRFVRDKRDVLVGAHCTVTLDGCQNVQVSL